MRAQLANVKKSQKQVRATHIKTVRGGIEFEHMSSDEPLMARGCVATAFDYRGKQLAVMDSLKQPCNHLKNPKAGMVLYNGRETIKQGAFIAKFNGTIIKHEQLRADEQAVQITKDYCLRRHAVTTVEGCAWYINASKDQKSINCCITVDNKVPHLAERANVRATRAIKPGQQLLINYGAVYWKSGNKQQVCAKPVHPDKPCGPRLGRNFSKKKTQLVRRAEKAARRAAAP